MAANFIPGLNVVTSLGMMAIDLYKGDYVALAMDSVGLLVPGAAVGLKLAYDAFKVSNVGIKFGLKALELGSRAAAKIERGLADGISSFNNFIDRGANLIRNSGLIPKYVYNAGSVSSGASYGAKIEDALRMYATRIGSGTSHTSLLGAGSSLKFFSLKTYKQSKSNKVLVGDIDYVSPQKHHILQNEWAKNRLEELGYVGYDPDKAPVLMLETGKGFPHSEISALQTARKSERLAQGKGKWSSSLEEELENSRSDLKTIGMTEEQIESQISSVLRMLDKLRVK